MSDKKKHVHTINLEIPMDFWFAVERQVIESKMKGSEKVTKKSHILELIELGYAKKDKLLKKANLKPNKDSLDAEAKSEMDRMVDGGWKTDEG